MRRSTVVRGGAATRTLIGLALALAPRALLRRILREEEPSSTFLVFARTVGIRDALFGLGFLLASLSDDAAVTRRWTQLWLANETADVVAAAVASRQLGPAGAVAAALPPLPFIGADIWALRRIQ